MTVKTADVGRGLIAGLTLGLIVGAGAAAATTVVLRGGDDDDVNRVRILNAEITDFLQGPSVLCWREVEDSVDQRPKCTAHEGPSLLTVPTKGTRTQIAVVQFRWASEAGKGLRVMDIRPSAEADVS